MIFRKVIAQFFLIVSSCAWQYSAHKTRIRRSTQSYQIERVTSKRAVGLVVGTLDKGTRHVYTAGSSGTTRRARRQLCLRDWLHHQGVHHRDPRRHGSAWRGQARRSHLEVSPGERQAFPSRGESRSRCSISRRSRPACRGCRTISSRRTWRILTPTTPSSRCTISSPATRCRATSDHSSSTRISASACWVTFSRCAPARVTRRS